MGIQAGIIGIVVLLVLSIGGGMVWTYNSAIKRAKDAEAALIVAEKDNARLEAKIETQQVLHEAQIERVKAGMERQQENTVIAEARKARATVDKITATSARDAEKYTAFVRDVLPKNLNLLSCLSDLRSIHAPADPCIGSIH